MNLEAQEHHAHDFKTIYHGLRQMIAVGKSLQEDLALIRTRIPTSRDGISPFNEPHNIKGEYHV